jgi:hypothetical protein
VRYNRFTRAARHRFGAGIIVVFNIIAVAIALHAVSDDMQDDHNDEAFAATVPEERVPPREALLPMVTLTKEMKIQAFFDNLKIDYADIDPDHLWERISPWEPHIIRYASQYRIDPDLVRAIIYAESKGDPYSVSRDGALGLMQIMPTTADFVGVGNMLDPEENIKAGVRYIAWLVKKYDEHRVIWAWNAGPSKTNREIMPGETKRFIVEVLSVKSLLKDTKGTAIGGV